MFPYLKNEQPRGTEQTAKYVNENIIPNLNNIKNYDMRIEPGNRIVASNPVVFWLQNFPNQYSVNLNEIIRTYQYKLKCVIAVSNFHKTKCQNYFNKVPVYVCNNGFIPSSINFKKFEKVNRPKLVFSSAPHRGLDILLSATEHIDLDFELYIFSNYIPDWGANPYFDKYGKDPRIFFFGQIPNKSVRKLCEESHIFSYPSTYQETFCLSLVEGMSAGCLPVIPSIGALPEISGDMGINFSWSEEFTKQLETSGFVKTMDDFYFKQPEVYKKNVDIFSENLYKSIEIIKKGEWNPTPVINKSNLYDWNNIKKQWEYLDFLISN